MHASYILMLCMLIPVIMELKLLTRLTLARFTMTEFLGGIYLPLLFFTSKITNKKSVPRFVFI